MMAREGWVRPRHATRFRTCPSFIRTVAVLSKRFDSTNGCWLSSFADIIPLQQGRTIMATRSEQLRGGVIGLLVGDALGVPYEFHGPGDIPPRGANKGVRGNTVRHSDCWRCNFIMKRGTLFAQGAV